MVFLLGKGLCATRIYEDRGGYARENIVMSELSSIKRNCTNLCYVH